MPFYYYGGKSGMAMHYPAPEYGCIIEPFAGAAGYSLRHATADTQVILIEKNWRIAELWERIQRFSVDDVASIQCPPIGERTTEPLIVAACAGQQFATGIMAGARPDYQVTSRMARDFPKIQKRIIAALPLIRNWQICCGDAYRAPDMEATWFIDPPYWVHPDRKGTNGDGYSEGASAIDFPKLGSWCRSRRGQVIVCEQLGASWLPFRPLVERQTAAARLSRRTEVIWTNEPEALEMAA
jgi:hypothetical protein